VLLFHSLEFAGALLGEDRLDGLRTLVSTLRLTYLNEIIVPSVHAERMSWVQLIFWGYVGFVLSLRSGVFRHHSFKKLQWSLLFDTGEHKIRSIEMTQVSQGLAKQLLLHGLIGLRKLVVLRPNDRDWNHGFIDPVGVSDNFAPSGIALLLYPSEIL